MDHHHLLLSLIDRVYDAVVDDKAWMGLAEEIARVFGSTSAVLKVQDANEHVHLLDMTGNLAIDPKRQGWADHWHRNDLWVEKSIGLGLGRIVTSHDLIPDAEFRRTAFYGDWIRHLDIYHMIGCVFPIETDAMGVVGIHRPHAAGAYQDSERRRLARFLPHLQRAFRMRNKLLQARVGMAAALGALERTHSAVMVVEADLSILFASHQAEEMLRRSSEIDAVGGRLKVHPSVAASRIASLVQGCIHAASGAVGSAGGAITIPRPGRFPLSLAVEPTRPALAGVLQRPSALIFIRDPEALNAASETLRQLFGLTRTEAAVAHAITQGQSLTEIAEGLAVGLGTVRSHLKKVLSKTHTRKQAELVALLLRSAAGIQS